MASSLPADILARYYRLKGYKVCLVSGSDCFGTPISIQAQKENKTPENISNEYHNEFVNIFKKLDFSFDIYSKTNSFSHINFAKQFHNDLYKTKYIEAKIEKRLFCTNCNRFLPDRYVVGICPKCGKQSKGDACENCGGILEPEDLINPKCGICGEVPNFKNTKNYYIKLKKLQKEITEYFDKIKPNCTKNVIDLTTRYLNDGLIDRAISRDLDWGVLVPSGESGKVIYNWGENVLGYLSACQEYCKEHNSSFEDWFKNKNTKHIYIHAKDNIQFHSIISPALLIANPNRYDLPDEIFAYEFVTNNGQKISKSKGTCLLAKELLNVYDVDFLRYYFAKNISEKRDLNFTEKELINCINGELINNWGNLVNRVLVFVKNKFNGTIKKSLVDNTIKSKIIETFKLVSSYIEKGKVANGLKEILSLVDFSNKYFNDTEPWKIIKNDYNKAENFCYQYLNLVANLSVLLNPYIPSGTNKVANWLNIKIDSYQYKELDNVNVNDFETLYKRINEKNIENN